MVAAKERNPQNACLSCCRTPRPDSWDIVGDNESHRLNSGQICVKLKLELVKGITWLAQKCALALDTPDPVNYGQHARWSAQDTGPSIDLQKAWDTLHYTVLSLDDCKHSIQNYLSYIIRWQCPPLSLGLVVIWISICWRTW